MAIDDLYEADFLLWTERQAAELRGLAKSRRDLPNALDLEHVAEEIEDLGRSELAAVKSYIRQILIHAIKIAARPQSDARFNWAEEIATFRRSLRDRYAPAMRQRIEMDRLWQDSLEDVDEDFDVRGEASLAARPESCPIELADVIDETTTRADLIDRISRALQTGD